MLLVTSLLAPIAVGPAAADDGELTDEFDGTCESNLRFVLPVSCGHADPSTVDDSLSDDRIEADIHVNAQGTGEAWDSTDILLGNYLEDTPTIASLEARDGIATAWEEGKSVEEADNEALQRINDYYSRLQIQVIEETQAHMAELQYQANQSREIDDVSSSMVHPVVDDVTSGMGSDRYSHSGSAITDDTSTEEFDLRNGSVHEYEMPHFEADISDSDTPSTGSDSDSLALDDKGDWSFQVDVGANNPRAHFDGRVMLENQPEYDLDSKETYDLAGPAERLEEIHDQAQVAVENYDEQFVEDLYHSLDEGQITPEDVRGAEGTVRYMSGDSEVTENRFQMALASVTGMEHTSMESTMEVHYDGYTDMEYEWNSSSEEREQTFSNHVSTTYEGLLFAAETPEDGFEVNGTYHTDDLNGTQMMVPADGSDSVYFEKGTFTIDTMYDADGNETDQADWDRPDYDTYNSSEYVELLDEVQELHDKLEEEDDGGDDELTLPGVPDLDDAIEDHGTLILGFVAIGAAVLIVVSFVTNLLPWT
ncbi:hypothetical protein [Natrarchaeobaculum sulfurireducens]|uniref:hypothetical protein n=1 Tax=Natrarchaeobaculum sulfurireducens TaxID=2044521 RepID=UPI00105AB0D8|nr:hypothetical protein [Natrarchaeobaculum sulfurireducens]